MLRRFFIRAAAAEPTSTRRSLKRSRRRGGAVVSALALAGAFLSAIALPVPRADAVYGNPSGGAGRFAPVIDWIDWTEMSGTRTENWTRILPDGGTGISWSTPTQVSDTLWRTSRCTISNVVTTVEGNNEPRLTTHKGIEVEYNTGNWQGDGLSRLYNDGTNYSGGVSTNSSKRSNLLIGIENLQHGSTHQFQVDCKTYIVESSTKPAKSQLDDLPNKVELPMEGMVFADAESSNWQDEWGQREYITVSPIAYNPKRDVSYRLLETVQPKECATNSWGGLIKVSTPVGERDGLKLRPDGDECNRRVSEGYGPSSVMFVSNMQSGFVEVHGGGKSAVALGVVSYLDYGDAPSSYGTAGSVFQPSWSGGQLAGGGALDVSSQSGPAQAESGSWFNLTHAADQQHVATAGPAVVRLGGLTDQDQSISHSADASADDTTGIDDEDALSDDWDRVIWTDIGQKWSQQITCTGSGTKIAGWIDWNRDGSFSPDEGSETTTCSSAGTATVTWTVPTTATRTTLTADGVTTFMRLRITGPLANDQEAEDPQPTGIALNGEVEDYPVQVQLPNLTMTKTVDNTAAGDLGLTPADWTLTATPTTGNPASGPGGFTSPLPQGAAVLSETSTSPKAAGYKPTFTCAPHPNSDLTNPASTFKADTRTLTLATGEWMNCTVHNTAQPGQLTWTKVDETGNPLPGATFTLTSPKLPGGKIEVPDCIDTGKVFCYPDEDNRAGYFRVSRLTWGEYSLTETKAPTGYQASTETLTKTLDGSAPLQFRYGGFLPTLDLGQVTNARIQGTVTWTKTDETNHPLKGSQWSLTPLDQDGHPITNQARTITDCITTCPKDSLDTDTSPGAFKLTNLTQGTYQLTETKAPTGYTLEAAPHTITITTAGQLVELGNITNRKSAVPTIPLTGGTAAQRYLIAGAALLAITALAMTIQARKRRRIHNQ